MITRLSLWFWDLMRLVGRNWITALGGALATVSALLIIAFLILGLLGFYDTPYIGIMAFLVLPGVFVLGLLLIPVGVYWERRRARQSGDPRNPASREVYPCIDFNRASVRRTAGIVSVLTVVNLLLISLTTYKGVTYMDSVEFCGLVCHSVMEPEYTAYKDSPHSRVKCVECHIGPGAPWFVRSKLSGVGQVFATALNTYSRPIPTPVENLRPSRDTCEQCHWPEKFTGDRVKVITRFAEDEANTPLKTVLLMHIGGGAAGQGGIHSWHIDPNKQTIYIAADAQRQIIPWVQVREANGRVTEFVARDAPLTPDQLARAERRVMDCMDCHNRPTHIFRLPDRAMDEALVLGRIDRTLPYIKKLGVEVLRAAAEVQSDAPEEIARRVRSFYGEKYPELFRSRREAIEAAIRELQAIYRRNVFPSMRVTWGTYPDHLGHTTFPGCFRCHDEQHVSADGRTISQSCDLCHTLLAIEEPNPPILQQLNIR
jgi:hypothetical protein